MNPTTPIAVPGVAIPANPGDRRRRDPAAEQRFRRALQQQGGAGPAAAGSDRPAAPALQPEPGAGRRGADGIACHVDVVA